MKNLGFGLMRLPVTKKTVRNEKIDKVQSAEMIKAYLDAGYNYFDTAYMYHGGKSESAAGELLCSVYERESFLLASKMPVGMLVLKGDTSRIFRHQLKRCGVEYFDYYLLHAMMKKTYRKYDDYHIWDFVKEKKAKGLIKYFGFSFHSGPELLDQIEGLLIDDRFLSVLEDHPVILRNIMAFLVLEMFSGLEVDRMPQIFRLS